MYILIFFLFIVVIKLMTNLFQLISTYYFHHKFLKQSDNIDQLSSFVTSLFNSANTQVIIVNIFNASGVRQGRKDYISNNLSDMDNFTEINKLFHKTIGVFKYRALQSINPFYWLFLPKYILAYFNIGVGKITSIFLSLIYWSVSVIAGHYLELFLTENLDLTIQQFLNGFL